MHIHFTLVLGLKESFRINYNSTIISATTDIKHCGVGRSSEARKVEEKVEESSI